MAAAHTYIALAPQCAAFLVVFRRARAASAVGGCLTSIWPFRFCGAWVHGMLLFVRSSFILLLLPFSGML
jgi:hypothetical protein